jgi:hypothetical protein
VVRGLNTPKCSLCSRGDVQRSLPVSGSRPESGVGQPLETTRRTRPRTARSFKRCSRFKGVACGPTVPDSVTRVGRQDRVFTVPGQQQQYYQLLRTGTTDESTCAPRCDVDVSNRRSRAYASWPEQTKPLPQTVPVPSYLDA